MTISAPGCGIYEKSKADFDAVVASLLVNVLGLAIPIAMLQIFDRVIPNQSLPTLDAIFLLMLAVVAVDTLLKILRGRLVLANGAAAERALARRLTDRLFSGDLRRLQRLGNDALLERLLAPGRLKILLSGQAGLQRIDLGFSAIYLLVIGVLSGVLVIVPLAAICTICVIARQVRPFHQRAIRVREANGTARMSLLRDVLTRAKSLKLLGGESRFMMRFADLQDQASIAQRVSVRVSDVAFTTAAMAGPLTTGILSLTGGCLVIVEAVDLADLAACIMLSGRAVQPFVQTFLSEGEVSQAQEIARTLDDVLSVQDAPKPNLISPGRDLAIEAVGLRWRNAMPQADALSFTAAPGALVTIGGDRGDDASDVVRIMAGLRSAAGGSVRLHGRRASFGAPEDAATSVILVPRVPDLFQGSLRRNLTTHRPTAADGAFISGLLDVHGEIDMLPEGIEWRFEGANRGGGSPGLHKKVALAAALAGDADILLLDTPSVGLDPASRRLLREHLVMTKGIATVVVANAEPGLVEESDLHIQLSMDGPPTLTRSADMGELDEADVTWLAEMEEINGDRKAS